MTIDVMLPKVASQCVSIVAPTATLVIEVPILAVIETIHNAIALKCVGINMTAVPFMTDAMTPDRTRYVPKIITCNNWCVTK